MRDSSRIRPMLDKIADYWSQYPDWRLGQLIENVVGNDRDFLFYIEDEQLMDKFSKFFNK